MQMMNQRGSSVQEDAISPKRALSLALGMVAAHLS